MTKIRGFELVSTYTNQDLLPKRETAHAAGYDLKVAERTVIAPGNKDSQDNGAPLAFASFCDDYPNREWTVFHI